MASKSRIVAAQALYERAKELGVRLKVEGKKILFQPSEILPSELIDALYAHIKELRVILVDEALTVAPPINPTDDFTEAEEEPEEVKAAPKWTIEERMKRFARRYVQSLNATDAYFKSGYRPTSRASAGQCASKLLKNPKVQRFIEEIRAKTAQKTEAEVILTLTEKRNFLARVVRAAPGEIDQNSDLCNGYKITDKGEEFKMVDKAKAIELDSKLAGDFKEKPVVIEAGDTLTQFLSGLRKKKPVT